MASDVMDQDLFAVPSSALVCSLLLHIAIPFLLVTFHVLDGWGLFPFFHHQLIKREVYQNFIQVDVVALPDALVNEKHPMDMSLPIVPKPGGMPEAPKSAAVEETMKLPSDGTSASDAAKKRLAQEAAEKTQKDKIRKAEETKVMKHLKDEAEREAALNSIAANQGKQKGREKLAGNILSKGVATTGMIGTAKDQYNALISQSIHDHFNIYFWQQKKKLFAVVHIELYPNTGRIRSKKVVKPSADPLYDSAVLQAIDQAQPLPLPQDLSLIEDGITIDFRPE